MSSGEPANPIDLTPEGFVDIGRVVNGGSFGALALVDGKPRLTTAKCITNCHFLVLHKDDWEKAYDANV